MSNQNKVTLQSDINTKIYENTTQDITGANLNEVLTSLNDSKVSKLDDIDTDSSFTANSDLLVPSQKAVKTAIGGYQLTSGKDASSGYVGISSGNVITLPLGRGFVSNNVTPNQIAYFDNSGNLLTLSVATYPSITELAYVKGVTSAIQTQINAKVTGSGTSSGTNTGDQTFLNARVQTVTSSATVTPTSTNDIVIITAQAVGLTLANPTGTFTEGQALMIRIKDSATAQTIAFGTNYRAIGVTLPTTTVISKTMYLGIIYNATDGKWDVLGTPQQA